MDNPTTQPDPAAPPTAIPSPGDGEQPQPETGPSASEAGNPAAQDPNADGGGHELEGAGAEFGPPDCPDGGEDTGAELLDELRSALSRYVILPSTEALHAVTLWVAATHLQHGLRSTRRGWRWSVRPSGAASRRLLDVLTETVHKPVITVNASTAAIFRSMTDESADTAGGRGRHPLRQPEDGGEERGDCAACSTPVTSATVPPCASPAPSTSRLRSPPSPWPRSRGSATCPTRSWTGRWWSGCAAAHRARRWPPSAPAATSRTCICCATGSPPGPARSPSWRWSGSRTCRSRTAPPTPGNPWWSSPTSPEGPGLRLARSACARDGPRFEAGQDEEGGLKIRILADIRRAFASCGDPEALATTRLLGILKQDAEAPWAEYGTSGLTPRGLQLLLRDYGISLGQHPLPRRHPGQGLRPQQVPRRLGPLLPHPGPSASRGLTRLDWSHPSPRSSPPGRVPGPQRVDPSHPLHPSLC